MDRGFTLGHGIFETIYFEHGKIPFLNYHMDRIKSSSDLVGIKLPFTFDELEQMISELFQENDLQEKKGGIRVTLTDGVSERGILSSGKAIPTVTIFVFEMKQANHMPLTATIVPYRRNETSITSKVKSTSYLDNIMAKKYAVEHGFDEAIFLNTCGNISECSVFNLFIVKDNVVFTPLISDGALPGIFRRVLLNDVSIDNFAIIERTISKKDLDAADEVFVTNALMGIRSISKIDNIEYHVTSLGKTIMKIINEKFKIHYE